MKDPRLGLLRLAKAERLTFLIIISLDRNQIRTAFELIRAGYLAESNWLENSGITMIAGYVDMPKGFDESKAQLKDAVTEHSIGGTLAATITSNGLDKLSEMEAKTFFGWIRTRAGQFLWMLISAIVASVVTVLVMRYFGQTS